MSSEACLPRDRRLLDGASSTNSGCEWVGVETDVDVDAIYARPRAVGNERA